MEHPGHVLFTPAQPLHLHSDFTNQPPQLHYISSTNQPPQHPSAFMQEAQWAGPGLSTIGALVNARTTFTTTFTSPPLYRNVWQHYL